MLKTTKTLEEEIKDGLKNGDILYVDELEGSERLDIHSLQTDV